MNKDILDKLNKEQQESNKKFVEISSSFASTVKKYETAKANGENTKDVLITYDDLAKVYNDIYSSIRYVHDRIDSNYKSIYACMDELYKHSTSNHVPPLPAGPMKKFLKVIGLDENYEVVPKAIYCSAAIENKNSVEIEIKQK